MLENPEGRGAINADNESSTHNVARLMRRFDVSSELTKRMGKDRAFIPVMARYILIPETGFSVSRILIAAGIRCDGGKAHRGARDKVAVREHPEPDPVAVLRKAVDPFKGGGGIGIRGDVPDPLIAAGRVVDRIA